MVVRHQRVNHVLLIQRVRKLNLLTDMCVDVIPFDWPIAVWANSCALLFATTDIVLCSEKALLWSYGPLIVFPDRRTAQFLNLLAQVDVMCAKLNDCQVKLQGIEFLLHLESRFQPYDIACKKQEMAADSEIISTLKHLTLDRVSNKYVINFGKYCCRTSKLTSIIPYHSVCNYTICFVMYVYYFVPLILFTWPVHCSSQSSNYIKF